MMVSDAGQIPATGLDSERHRYVVLAAVLHQFHQLRTSTKLVLLQQLTDVKFHRVNADRKPFRDLRVCETLRNELNNRDITGLELGCIAAEFAKCIENTLRKGR